MNRLKMGEKPSKSAHQAQASAPVDLVFLSRQTGDNRSLAYEVLQLFTHQNQIYIGKLREVQTSREWYEICHSFKGSSREIGAFQLAEVIEKHEHAVGDERSDREPVLKDIESNTQVVNEFIRKMLAE